MIVRDMMTTDLVTVGPDDTIWHAIGLFRQYQFHHLPVVQEGHRSHRVQDSSQKPENIFLGFVTTQTIELAAARAERDAVENVSSHSWQERHVTEIMHHPQVWVMPTTSVATAAQLLVERGMNCLPVIETEQSNSGSRMLLVGLLTRSDILLMLARALGAFEASTQVSIQLSSGQMKPLARALLIADELNIPIRSLLAVLHEQTSQSISLRLSTINPTPFLTRLKQEGIVYVLGDAPMEGEYHA